MRIAIPSDDDKLSVCQVFGRTPLFAVLDTEKDEISFVDNSAKDEEGGAGVKAAQVVLDEMCDVLLTPRLGENSAKVFNVAEVKIYKTEGYSIEENFKLWKEDKLSLLTHFHGGYQGIK